MRAAMAAAQVGDDVYGDDPTVNQLQTRAAEMLGKEAALFVPSGTMGNLIAMMIHCGRGDEVILGNQAHTFLHEAGGVAALGGVHPCQIINQPDGTLALSDIEAAIRPDDVHEPITRLITIENTQNSCGGIPLSLEYTRQVGQLAKRHGIAVHLDGARLFNAAVALNTPAAALVEPVDSVSFCLSKGLCAPVGSMLVGSEPFIRRALRLRKMLGGGMRQVGVLAAAGLVALDTMIERLADDHTRAKRLAAGLAALPGIILEPGSPHTNMIFFRLTADCPLDPQTLAQRLEQAGIQISPYERIRLVTHYWIDDDAIDRTLQAFRQALV
jgi:threonine aldolase